jgi:hypothetical protein
MRAAIAALVLAPAVAHAEPPDAPLGNDVAADAVLVVPFADWAKETGVGAGASARLRVPLSPYTTITARLAAIWHAPHDDGALTVGLVELPLVGGVRYYVTAPGPARAFLAGEVGVVLQRGTIAQGGATDAAWRFVFGSSLGAGVEVDRYELTASVWLPDVAHVDNAAAAMITVGASFGAW